VVLRGHQTNIRAVAFSPSGETLASCEENGTILLWDVTTGQIVARYEPEEEKNRGFRLAFHPDGRRLTVQVRGGAVLFLDGHSLQPKPSPSGTPLSEFHSVLGGNGQTCAVVESRGNQHIFSVTLYDLLADAPRTSFNPVPIPLMFWLGLSPNLQRVAVYTGHGEVALWDLPSGRLLARLAHPVNQCVHRMLTSPDGRTLAVDLSSHDWPAPPEPTVHLWDLATYHLRATVPHHDKFVTSIAFSADSKFLAACGSQGTVQVWDVEAGREELALAWGEENLQGIAFSPDGRLLAVGGPDGSVRLMAWRSLGAASLTARSCATRPSSAPES
jgi:WD40 repeat protein